MSAVRPSASSFVVGFSVDLATSRNLLPAVTAQGAALLMGGDRSPRYRHPWISPRVADVPLICPRCVAGAH